MYAGEQNSIEYSVKLLGESSTVVVFSPSAVNDGIVIKRTDTGESVKIDFNNVYIDKDGIHTKIVKNIEMLLVSLWACDIDNILISINSDKTPNVNSESISFLLTTAGLKKLGVERDVFSIKSQINNDFVSISESDTFLISFDDFVFNNKIHPYKNWISHVKKGDKGYEVLLIIAMFFVSGKFSRIDMNVKKFDNGEVFKIIKNLFNG